MEKKKKETPEGDEKEVRIYSLATTANECIVFLEELEGDRLLPIWIGLAEGQAIAIRFSGISLPRPLTHDLLLASIETLGWKVQRVVVTDLKENTFYATIYLASKSGTRTIDARPSDAIALALRTQSPIYVEEAVMESAQSVESSRDSMDVGRLRKWLEGLSEDELGKYKM